MLKAYKYRLYPNK
ncbi:MAG: helix-turn-helix domain-containing protein, partial [Methanosarcinaceae archaeon]|nr:helix-turn-helix domain-containing protein [Methanosarcinaceae archaeon]MBN1134347.1 helix-turn-helix domain-containing protein [Methanosarcinaceae archaeon]